MRRALTLITRRRSSLRITEDNAPQEQVYESLPLQPRAPTRRHLAATDRRGIYVGAEPYTQAGGTIIRDLFSKDRGGFYRERTAARSAAHRQASSVAESVKQAEGWKWRMSQSAIGGDEVGHSKVRKR